MDAEDLLTRALEPGERIIWSDRPRGMLWPLRAAYAGAGPLEAGCATLVIVAFLLVPAGIAALGLTIFWLESLFRTPSADMGSAAVIVCAMGGPAIAVLVFELSDFLKALATRYAVTDRGHGLVAVAGTVSRFDLARASITTRARGKDEFGDLDLGTLPVETRGGKNLDEGKGPIPRRVIFHRVSYPLVALESVRAVAIEDVDSRAQGMSSGAPEPPRAS